MPRLARLVPLLAVLLAGCDPARDYLAVFREQQALWDEVAGTLSKVRGADDFPAAQAALEKRLPHFQAVARRARALRQPSPAVIERLEEERRVMERSVARYMDEVRRVRALPGGEAFFKQLESDHQGLFRTGS